MDTVKSIAGTVVFGVLAGIFGYLAVRYNNIWAQTITGSALMAAGVAFQVSPNQPKP